MMRITLDKEKTFILNVKIFNPSKSRKTVYLELDALGFEQNYKRYPAIVVPPTNKEMINVITENVVLGTPDSTGDYVINLKLLDEEEKVINDSRRRIPCKCKISTSKKIVAFTKGVISIASSVLP